MKRKIIILCALIVTIITVSLIFIFGGKDNYKVTFDLNDGTLVKGVLVQEVKENTKATPPEVNRTGYTFNGWYTTKEFTNDSTWTVDKLITEDITIYAKWTINEYTYTFYDENKSKILKQETLIYNSEIIPPSNPSKVEDLEYSYIFNHFDGFTSGMKLDHNYEFIAVYDYISKYATVSYHTFGGETITPTKVYKGEKLSSIPSTLKDGFMFENWYKDINFNQVFYSDETITDDLILYAKFTYVDLYNEGDQNNLLLEKQDSDFTFSVYSTVELTEDNFTNYLEVQSFGGRIPNLTMTKVDDSYLFGPTTGEGYEEGGLYAIIIAEELSFVGYSKNIRQYNIRINKEQVTNISLNNDMKYRDLENVVNVRDKTFFIKDTETTKNDPLKESDLLCIWDGEYNENTSYLKVVSAVSVNNGQMVYVDSVSIEEIYDEIDLYIEQDVPFTEYVDEKELQNIVANLKESDSVREITRLLAQKLNRSETINIMQNNIFQEGVVIKPGAVNINVQTLLPGLSISCKIGSASNNNFDKFDKFDWTVLSITLDYNVTINNTIKIKASISIQEYLYGFIKNRGFKDVNVFTMGSTYFDYNMNILSQTEIDVSVLVCSTNEENEQYHDITSEIENMKEGLVEETPDNIITKVQEMLVNEGDYIELLNVPMFSYRINFPSPIPLLEASFGLNFVVKVNFAAGIGSHVSLLTGYQVGICGTANDGMNCYSNQIEGNTRYSIDVSAYGYIGIKAGFKLGGYLSFIGCTDLGKFGIYGEVGAYADIYGYLNLNLEQRQQWTTPEITSSFFGGLYLELGIYIDIGVEAVSDFFNASASYSFVDMKFKVFDFGDEYLLVELIPVSDNQIINRTGSLNIKDYVQGKFLNLKTGELKTMSINGHGSISVYGYNSKWAYDGNTDNFKLKDEYLGDLNRDTTKVKVTYHGSNLQFCKGDHYNLDLEVYYVNSDLGGSLEDIFETRTVTYMANIDGVEEVLISKKDIPYGTIPGTCYYQRFLGQHNAYLVKDFEGIDEPVTTDQTFTIYLKSKQYLVYYEYFDGTILRRDYYAVNASQVPTMPDVTNYTIDNGKIKFNTWSVSLMHEKNGNYMWVESQTAIKSNPAYWSSYEDFVYNDLNTTTPIYTFTGSTSIEIDIKVRDSNERIYALQFYKAKYDRYSFTVSFVSGNYEGGVLDFNNPSPTIQIYQEQYLYESIPSTDQYCIINGYELIGWDEDNDGKLDYPFGSPLPKVEDNQTYIAVYDLRECVVTFVDKDDFPYYTETIDYGTLPNTKPYAPEAILNDDVYYILDHYEIIYNYGKTVVYNEDSFIGTACSIKPVYTKYYKVEVDLDGAYAEYNTIIAEDPLIYHGEYPSYDADGRHEIGDKYTKATFMVKEDTFFAMYALFGTIEKIKIEDKEYQYIGYEIDDYQNEPVIVTDRDVVTINSKVKIKAIFEEKERVFHVKYTTEFGRFVNGEQTIEYVGNLAGLTEFETSLKNGPIEPNTPDKINEFWGWRIEVSEYETNTYQYIAVFWSIDARYDFTVKWGEGTSYTMPEGYTIQLEANTNCVPFLFDSRYQPIVPISNEYTYKLIGYQDEDGVLVTKDTLEYKITGNVVFTAVYEIDKQITYTITVNAGIGEFTDGKKIITYKGSYNEPFIFDVPTPAGEGYTLGETHVFNQWVVTAPWGVKEIPTKFDNDYTITAEYTTELETYTLSYYIDSEVIPYISQQYQYGEEIILPDEPVKDGYFFKGWTKWEIPVRDPLKYYATKDTNVRGYFIPNAGYKVIYMSDGIEINSEYFTHDIIVVPRFQENMIKEGYTFTGWRSNDISFDQNNSFVMPKYDVTLEAIWQPSQLIISNGVNSEVVNNHSQITGYTVNTYTYPRLNNDRTDGADVTWTTIKIYQNGLILSGYATNTNIIISKDVTDFTISNLVITNDTFSYECAYMERNPTENLRTEWPFNDSIIRVDYQKDTDINIKLIGNNAMYIITSRGSGIDSHRNMSIIGETNASIHIVSAYNGIISNPYYNSNDISDETDDIIFKGSIKLVNIQGSISTKFSSIKGEGVELDNCILDINSLEEEMIHSSDYINIINSQIKGYGTSWGIRADNVNNNDKAVSIIGLVIMNIQSKLKEALIVMDNTNDNINNSSIFFDLSTGSRIVLIGGMDKYDSETKVIDEKGNIVEKCWAIGNTRNSIIFNDCLVNGSLIYTKPIIDINYDTEITLYTITSLGNNENEVYNSIVITK